MLLLLQGWAIIYRKNMVKNRFHRQTFLNSLSNLYRPIRAFLIFRLSFFNLFFDSFISILSLTFTCKPEMVNREPNIKWRMFDSERMIEIFQQQSLTCYRAESQVTALLNERRLSSKPYKGAIGLPVQRDQGELDKTPQMVEGLSFAFILSRLFSLAWVELPDEAKKMPASLWEILRENPRLAKTMVNKFSRTWAFN